MSASGLRQFDETLQLTNSWLKEIMFGLKTDDRAAAYRALRSTLHALRDRLSVEEGAHLAAQLPLMVKGVFYDGWKPSHCGNGDRSADAFLAPIWDVFDNDPNVDAADVARTVFSVLDQHISHGQMEQVRHALPKQVRDVLEGTQPGL